VTWNVGRWPIRAHFVVLLAIVFATAIAASWVVESTTTRDHRRAAYADAGFAARTASKQLGDYLALVNTTVAQLAANPRIAQVFQHPAGCALTFAGLGGPDKSHVDIIDAAGKVACSSHPKAAGHDTYAGATWLSAALAKPQLVGPRRDPATGVDTVVITVPVAAGKGTIAGFVDLQSVGPALASLYSGGHQDEFLVTSADGRTVIARSVDPARWIGRPLGTTGYATIAGTGERDDLDGVSRLYASAAVAGPGWHFYVGERTAAVLAASERLERRGFAVVLAGLLAALLAVLLMQRSLVRPIRRLQTSLPTARETGAVATGGPRELRRLAEDVNTLVTSLNRELAERERIEDRIAESERSYRLLFESNPSPMWVYDVQTLSFLAVNDAAIQTYGYTREEFLATTIEEIRPPDDRARLRAVVLSADNPLQRGLNLSGTWRHRRKDGTYLDVEVVSQDHVFEGRAARIVLAQDITGRYEAEQALRNSEARYRDLFENATDMIATVDLDARFTAVNRAFAETLGYDAEELVGKPLTNVVPHEWHDELDVARDDKLDGEAAATVYVHDLVAKDGRHVPVEVASRVIFEDGVPTGIEAICRNLTERQSLEEQLRQSQRLEAIGRLAGGIAHDFNNLLTVISGYSEALLEESADAQPELNEIAAAAERATILTRQLLAFSRRQVLQARVVSMNQIADGLTPMLRRLIGEDVELEAFLDPAAGNVFADPSQIEQVLVNLVVNARDAMPNGGKLTISTGTVELDQTYVDQHPEASPGVHAVLAVSDTGIGMDEATVARAFEPFFTTKPAGTGTGLGLSTVYGIVKQSNGTIWVYSEPGHGTTFKVYLPAVQDAADVARPDEPRPDATGSETILVVEDERPVRDLVTLTLRARGYQVLAADTPAHAVELAANEPNLSLVLTDLVMPGTNGRDLAVQIRRQVPGVRVLFMSGYADEAVSRNGSLDADAAFLEKPFSAGGLATKIREVLDSPAAVAVR
jgi:two-component system, cell cycle sensor histidine kinase and response regulator CckA